MMMIGEDGEDDGDGDDEGVKVAHVTDPALAVQYKRRLSEAQRYSTDKGDTC